MTVSQAPQAGIGRRLASMFYELLLLVGVIVILLLPLVLFSTITNQAVAQSFLRVYLFLALAAYFIWHWHGGRQTLAMKTWKLKIVGSDGSPPQLFQLALRFVLAWPSIGLAGLGVVWAFVDRDRQFLHDRLAGTRIVNAAPPTTASPPPPA